MGARVAGSQSRRWSEDKHSCGRMWRVVCGFSLGVLSQGLFREEKGRSSGSLIGNARRPLAFSVFSVPLTRSRGFGGRWQALSTKCEWPHLSELKIEPRV